METNHQNSGYSRWAGFLLLMIFFFITSGLFGQDYSQTVKGKVIDVDTRVSLPGASIILLGSDPLKGTQSDINGNFRLDKVHVGRHTFEISYLGYEKAYAREVLVASGREVVLTIEMKESVTSLSAVTITAEENKSEAINQMATVSSSRISVESTSRIAAGIDDPGRTAQSFAGVAAADDENNELVIRGNSPRGMLWRMEGIEIPNPNHFGNGEGGSGGGVSALSTQVLANSDFFTGAFPAEYGNALSGVIDLSLRNGNYEKREYAFQVGVLGTQAALEGPVKKGSEASYLLNYRFSTLKLLDMAGVSLGDEDIAPEWQDLSFKVYLPTKKAGRFSVWGLGGISADGSIIVEDTSKWEYRGDHYRDYEKHTIGILGLTHNYLFSNNKTYIKTVAALSHTKRDVTEDSLNYIFEPAIIIDEDFTYNNFSVNSYINHKFSARHLVRAGITYHTRSYNVKMLDYDHDEQYLELLIDESGSTDSWESFVQYQYRVSEKVEINSGLHYTLLSLNKDYAVEPRLGVRWRVSDKHTLNFGTGLHSRPEPVSIYLAERVDEQGVTTQPNRDLKMTRAAHVVLGHNWNFGKDFRLKTEVYYQHLYDVPVKVDDTTHTLSALNFSSGFTNEPYENKGKGRNYGLELSLEKFFSDNWYLLATGSVFESKYTMPDGIERDTYFNTKYIYNLVAGKEFAVGSNDQNMIGANIRLIWRGGYRTTPVDLEASHFYGEDRRDWDQAFETKAPDYFRADIGVSYRKNKPGWSWIVSLNIQNVTDRGNVWDEYYDPEQDETVKYYMVGLIPVLNYRIEL